LPRSEKLKDELIEEARRQAEVALETSDTGNTVNLPITPVADTR